MTEKKVGSSFAKFLAGETNEELQNSSDVQAFLIEGKDLETSINSLLLNQIRNGMTDEQFFNVVMNSSRDNSVGITATIKKNDGKYPDGLHLSKYSSKLSKQKEEFSLKALKAFAAGKRDNMRKTDFVREGAAHGLYTEIQAQNIVSERDLYRILLKPGIEPETVSENQRRLNLFVGKNLDKNKYTEQEYNDLLKQQKAEVINKRLQELATVDYSKFDHMDDEKLVENWVEYVGHLDALSIFKAESKGSVFAGNPYVDQELVKKVNDIEYKYNTLFIRDSGRIRAMANPYYAKYDFKGFEKLSPGEISNINDGRLSGNANLSNLFVDLGVWHSGNIAVFLCDVTMDMRKTVNGLEQEDLRFFDAKGNPLKDSAEALVAAKKGAVFAAPKDRPELLKPYSFDSKLLGGKELDPKPYAKVMNKIKSNIIKTWAAEEEILNKGDFKDFMSGTQSFRSHADGLAKQIKNAEDPEKMKEMMISALKRNGAPHHPEIGYDKYAKIIGLKPSEKLSPDMVEERRQLTERALTGMVEQQLNAPEISEESGRLIGSGGTSIRQFKAFMLKSTDSKAANDKIIREFFNGDAKTKKEMILKRVAEYKTQIDGLYGKSITDKEIVDKMNDIHTVATGMGMEYITTIANNIKTWGLDFSQQELDMMNDLNAKASTINDILVGRLNIIATPHYQFGGLEKLDHGGDFKKYSKSIKDVMFNKSADTVSSELGFVNLAKGKELLKQADPSGKKKLEGAFDANGNYISGDDIQGLGKHGFDSGRVFLFYKGEKEPVVFDCKKSDVIPPEVSAAKELSPEMKAQFGNMRLDVTINAIDANRKLAPEMRELEKSIVYKGHEMEVIAEGLNSSPQNKDVLKRKMAEYLASLTIRQLVEKSSKNIDKETLKGLTSAESIKKLSSDLRKSPVTDLVIDNILKDSNGFKDLDSRAVYDTMLNQMGTATRIAEAKKKEVQRAKNIEAAQSIKTISENKKVLLSDNSASEYKLYGLSADLLSVVESSTDLKTLSVDRASIQTQAFSIMLEWGYTVDQALEDSPQMQNARQNAAKQAIAETVGGNVEAIRRHLFTGTEKVNQYISEKTGTMKELSMTELAKPEYKNLRTLSPLIKDFFQELNTANGLMPEDKRWPQEKIDKASNINDFANKLFPTLIEGVKGPLDKMNKKGKDFDPCMEVGPALCGYLKGILCVESLKTSSKLPENTGKPIEECWNERTFSSSQTGYMELVQNDQLSDFIEKCQNDKALANKVYRSILDDSLRKDVDLKVFYKDGNNYEIKFDVKNLEKAMNKKLSVDIPSSVNKLENGLQHKQEEKAPVENGPKIPQ